MGKERLVVVGNGMPGIRTVEELLKLAPDLYNITVFGAEPHPNYNRIMLSPVLAGGKTVNDIVLNTREWYAENGIALHTGDPVSEIDRGKRVVRTATGQVARYDRLLLATGSMPFIIPMPGSDKQGVIGFRDIADVETMLAAARTHKPAAACWAWRRPTAWPRTAWRSPWCTCWTPSWSASWTSRRRPCSKHPWRRRASSSSCRPRPKRSSARTGNLIGSVGCALPTAARWPPTWW